jgi:hypothetical protein
LSSFCLVTLLLFSTVPTISEVSRITIGNLKIKSSPSYFGCTIPSNSLSRVLNVGERIEFLLNSNSPKPIF